MIKIATDVLKIIEWIEGCTTFNQLQNIKVFYGTIITTQFYPYSEPDDIHDCLSELDKSVDKREIEIMKMYADKNSKLQENFSRRNTIHEHNIGLRDSS